MVGPDLSILPRKVQLYLLELISAVNTSYSSLTPLLPLPATTLASFLCLKCVRPPPYPVSLLTAAPITSSNLCDLLTFVDYLSSPWSVRFMKVLNICWINISLALTVGIVLLSPRAGQMALGKTSLGPWWLECTHAPWLRGYILINPSKVKKKKCQCKGCSSL